ncbi:drug resistance transporter, EmrB/QacA subfamily [Gordonia sp. v-85]|nr:drug resistance transporter, EmrB/QacA subfamily [Gordonia sp. v-85]
MLVVVTTLDPASRRIGLILVVPTLMVMLDVTVVTVALPQLTTEFDAPLSSVQWVTTAYALALVAVMPLSAYASNRFGGRRVYCAALLVFVLGSLLTALSWNIGSLIVFRALQGLGGGMLQPVGMAIALQAVPEALRGRMMAILGLPTLVGPVLGPVLGGVLVDHGSWRVVFAVNVPLGLIAAVLAWRFFPRTATRGVPRIDLRAVAALSLGGAFLVLGLSRAGDTGSLLAASILVPVGIGLVLLGYFVRRSLRSRTPVLDLRLLAHARLRGGVVVMIFFAGAYFGSMTILPIYVQSVRSDSATTAGMLFVLPALLSGITLQIATRVADSVDPRRVAMCGIVLSTTAMILMATLLDESTPYPAVVAILALMGIGVGATMLPTMTAATRDLESADTPGGTTILTTSNQFAVALASAAITATIAALMNSRSTAVDGRGVAGAMSLSPAERIDAAPELASAIADTYLLTAGLLVCALLAAVFVLPARRTLRDARNLAPQGAG